MRVNNRRTQTVLLQETAVNVKFTSWGELGAREISLITTHLVCTPNSVQLLLLMCQPFGHLATE